MPYINSSQVDKTVHSSVKQKVEMLMHSTPARNTETPDFFEYVIDVESSLFSGSFSNIYLATHRAHPDQPLVARVYEPSARIDARKSTFLKVIKHIGKNSPWCIATWDIFFDEAGRVVIFQEYAQYGNLRDFLKVNRVYVPEVQVCQWASQLYRAMDFLGDNGICHRSICPKHVLLCSSSTTAKAEQTFVKLSSFRDSVLYYDPVIGSVKALMGGGGSNANQKMLHTAAHYQAPETFEEGPTYSPVCADVWSYGATLFYANTRVIPVNYSDMSQGERSKSAVALAGPQIEKAIAQAANLSSESKRWFTGILKARAEERTQFEQISKDPWFSQTSSGPQSKQGGVQPQTSQQSMEPISSTFTLMPSSFDEKFDTTSGASVQGSQSREQAAQIGEAPLLSTASVALSSGKNARASLPSSTVSYNPMPSYPTQKIVARHDKTTTKRTPKTKTKYKRGPPPSV